MATTQMLAGVYKSKKYSDIILVCEGFEFEAHRLVLCAKSTVLAAQCDGPYEVFSSPSKAYLIHTRWLIVGQESVQRRIEVNIEDANTVEFMLEYLYLSSYDIKHRLGALVTTNEADDSEKLEDSPTDIDHILDPNVALRAHVKVMCIAD